MNKLFLVSLLFLSLIAIASTHLHHRHHHNKKRGGVKKIVKVITVGRNGAQGRNVHKHSSSSSSSSSSEEVPVTAKPAKTTLTPPKMADPACDKGWLSFDRPTGLWCVLVGNKGADNHQLSNSEAEKICKEHSATLTGIQNSDERMEIANEALHQLGEINVEYGAVWLGATTNPACKTTSCGPVNTFKWTDGHTTGTSGYQWGSAEPDNLEYPGLGACIQQIVMTKTFTQQPHEKWLDAFKHGDLDKYKCEEPEKPSTRLFACGRKAR